MAIFNSKLLNYQRVCGGVDKGVSIFLGDCLVCFF